MAFPSQATSDRFLHNSLLGISRERLQVACDIVQRAPQSSFYVSTLCSLVQPCGNIHQLMSGKRWANVGIISEMSSWAGFIRAKGVRYITRDFIISLQRLISLRNQVKFQEDSQSQELLDMITLTAAILLSLPNK